MSRALVLGGGGVAGIAWELGILLGLLDAGIDLTTADRVVGTSAGSAVAAQALSGVPLADLFERQLSPALLDSEIHAEFDPEEMMREFGTALAGKVPGPETNRALGEYSLRARTVAEPVRRAVIERRLPDHSWPDRDLRITAIDALSGELRVFSKADGVELVDAVAASCAVPGIWPPVTIGTSRYIDGGMRSTANLDLAAGCDPVIVIGPSLVNALPSPEVTKGEEELRASASVVTIAADESSLAAIGANPLDPATARPAALAGRAQAKAHVEEVKAVWSQ
ncbi:MAG TPA: patatin-like phospholipase family protein [Mycobacteriales bacterium]|nr:patatin-like phospholipase family protein [Mycobacteriales bacterium]